MENQQLCMARQQGWQCVWSGTILWPSFQLRWRIQERMLSWRGHCILQGKGGSLAVDMEGCVGGWMTCPPASRASSCANWCHNQATVDHNWAKGSTRTALRNAFPITCCNSVYCKEVYLLHTAQSEFVHSIWCSTPVAVLRLSTFRFPPTPPPPFPPSPLGVTPTI
eukprot:941834-Rhodomonas_salina.1